LGEQVADEFGVHVGSPLYSFVMPGLVPGIHVSTALPI
jgi:hypothetical protein